MGASLLTTAARAALETSLNTALRFDPGTRLALARLEGQTLQITSTAPRFDLYFSFCEEGVAVLELGDDGATTRLQGSLPALAVLAASPSSTLSDSGVEVFGNTGLLSQLRIILTNLDIDWEEPVSLVLGNVAGHQAANTARTLVDWCKSRTKTSAQLLGEYLTEEIRCLPTVVELQGYYSEVDELRLASDRLTARLDLIREQMESKR